MFFLLRYADHPQSMIFGVTADGVVCLKVIVSTCDARRTTRTFTLGTFERGPALERLNPAEGSTVSGIINWPFQGLPSHASPSGQIELRIPAHSLQSGHIVSLGLLKSEAASD